MTLSSKSLAFAKKILDNYPLLENKGCSTCSHQTPSQNLQPFQHMHDHRKEREIYERPTLQKIQTIKYFKDLGNNKYKEKNYKDAQYFYQKAIMYSDYTFPDEEKQIAQLQVLIQQSNMNMAICLIKLDNWTQSLVYLREATKADLSLKSQVSKRIVISTRKKAYYWLSKYYIRQVKFDDAQTQINLLSELNSQISTKQEVEQLKAELHVQRKKYNQQSLDLSKKMFQS